MFLVTSSLMPISQERMILTKMARPDLRMFWQENQDKADSSNPFYEEIRRMERYDNEVCPEEWRAAVKHVKEKGIDTIEVMQKFGDRKFLYPQSVIESLANAYNEVQKSARFFPRDSGVKFSLPIQTQKFGADTMARLKVENAPFRTPNYQEIFKMSDKLKGFKLIFSTYTKYETYFDDVGLSNFAAGIFGLPDESPEDSECDAFSLGSLTLDGLKSISERRFTYSFGVSTFKMTDIAEEFARLYNLPLQKRAGRDREEMIGVGYQLEEILSVKEVMPKNVLPIFGALESARDKGLFSKVTLFEVKPLDLQLPQKYYLAAGVDHFNNKYPLAYIPSENDID